jgi:hypothetical protein
MLRAPYFALKLTGGHAVVRVAKYNSGVQQYKGTSGQNPKDEKKQSRVHSPPPMAFLPVCNCEGGLRRKKARSRQATQKGGGSTERSRPLTDQGKRHREHPQPKLPESLRYGMATEKNTTRQGGTRGRLAISLLGPPPRPFL